MLEELFMSLYSCYKCMAGEKTEVHFLGHTEGIKCEWTI